MKQIHNLINPNLWKAINESSFLIEKTNNSEAHTLQKVGICDIPKNVFIVTLDKKIENNKVYNQWLNNDESFINKSCDAVLINYVKEEVDLIFCELKSTTPVPSTYEPQLINTKLFFDYLITLYNCFINSSLKLGNIKFVLFYFKRPIQEEKSMRAKKTSSEPITTKMNNYPAYTILKHPFYSEKYQYVEWKTLLR